MTSAHPALDIRIFFRQAISLAKAGYSISIIGQHDKNEILQGIKIIALVKPKNRMRRFFSAPKILKLALLENAYLYHFHDFDLIPVGIILKLFGKKVIYDVHEETAKSILSKYWIAKSLRKSIALLVRSIEVFTPYIFDLLITNAEYIKTHFPGTNIICVTNFPTQDFLNTANSPPRKKRDYLKLIYTGGVLTYFRGITNMVMALGYLQENYQIRLILCGEFLPGHYKDELKKIKGFQKVGCLGWINPPDIPGLVRDADIGIVTDLAEAQHIHGMSTKLFEYMACGLPVIVSDFPLWKEIVEGNHCGICVDPASPAEIARAITYLAGHPEERLRMGSNGRKAVLEKYNWEKESKKLLGAYEKLYN